MKKKNNAVKKNAYACDGVDVGEETLFSRFAGSICKKSYKNSPFIEVHDFSGGNFRGPRPFSFKNLPKGFFIEASTDGIGTKGVLIDAAKTYGSAAYDLVAMTASDITRYGGLPLVLVNVFDTVSVGEWGGETSEAYKKAIRGLGEVVKKEKIVILKGETAQMGDCIGSEITTSKTKINWSGAMIGAYHKNKMITGESLAPGQVIIALREKGFRCNGISSVRKAFQKKFGSSWWNNPLAKKNIKEAAVPSVLYDPLINTLHGWFNKNFKSEITIHAVIHLSGGGIKEKLAKDVLFPRGLSAIIDKLWSPPHIMKECAKWRGISDDEFYEVWNGGQGMLLIIDRKDAQYCIKQASKFSIEAKIAGQIIKNKSKHSVVIHSKLTPGKKIIYS